MGKQELIQRYLVLNEARRANTWMTEEEFVAPKKPAVQEAWESGQLKCRPIVGKLMYIITQDGINQLSDLEENPIIRVMNAYDDLNLSWVKMITEHGGLNPDVALLADALMKLRQILAD